MKTKKIFKRLVGTDRPLRTAKRDSVPFYAAGERPFKKGASPRFRKMDAMQK